MSYNLIEVLEALSTKDTHMSDGLVVCTDHLKGQIYAVVEIGDKVPVFKIQGVKSALCEKFVPDQLKDTSLEFIARDADTHEPGHIILIASEEKFTEIFSIFLVYLAQARILLRPIVCCKFDSEH